MTAPADPLSAEERALLEDIAQGPVLLQARRQGDKVAWWYGWARPIDGLAYRGHKGGALVRLFARGWCDPNEMCDAFEITEAGRAALQDLQKAAAA